MADDVRDEWMAESLRHAGIHAMGRVTYESMARHWPSADSVFAEPMNRIPKVVFSRTLDRLTGPSRASSAVTRARRWTRSRDRTAASSSRTEAPSSCNR
jgi:dihydrofolate reductase